MTAYPLSSELFRTRDCVIWAKAETVTVTVDSALIQNGWKGGSGVTFAPIVQDQILVTQSNGLGGGFVLWGSDESSDQFTAITQNQPYYGFVVIGMGAWLIATPSFEMYTWASRQGPGPLVPIAYNASDPLFFSLRGLWTIEDEWTLSGDPRAPNDNVVGFVCQIPANAGDGVYYMSVQTDL